MRGDAAAAGYALFTFEERRDLRAAVADLNRRSWPAFLLHSDVRSWELLFGPFAVYQLLLCDASDTLIAVGHTAPIAWDGTLTDLPMTIEEILVRAERTHGRRGPNTLSALAAMVEPAQQGRNLSGAVIREMKVLAARHGCRSLVAPVRPTWKSRYPLVPFERYVEWRRDDGMRFDPWLRVHERLGATPLCVAPETLVVEGRVSEWEEWTGMAFLESGEYVVPGALQPVAIDHERDAGRYVEPNYWMKHPIG